MSKAYTLVTSFLLSSTDVYFNNQFTIVGFALLSLFLKHPQRQPRPRVQATRQRRVRWGVGGVRWGGCDTLAHDPHLGRTNVRREGICSRHGLRDSTVYYCTSPSFALTVSKYHELSLAWRCSPTLALDSYGLSARYFILAHLAFISSYHLELISVWLVALKSQTSSLGRMGCVAAAKSREQKSLGARARFLTPSYTRVESSTRARVRP